MRCLRAQAIATITIDVVNFAQQRASEVDFDFNPRKRRSMGSYNSEDDAQSIWPRNLNRAIHVPPFKWKSRPRPSAPRVIREDASSLALSTSDVRFSAFAGESLEVPALLAAEIKEAADWSLTLIFVDDVARKSLPDGVLSYRVEAQEKTPYKRVGLWSRNNKAVILAESGCAKRMVCLDLRVEVPHDVRAGLYRSHAVCSLYT